MTVCIAALCQDEGDPRAVVGADRMVTLGGFIEFEHAVPKITGASSHALAMIAGDSLVGNRLAEDAAMQIAGTNPPIADIARRLAATYDAARQTRMQEQYLTPRALTLQTYYGAHQSLSQQVTLMIDRELQEFDLGVEVLLAGVDATGAHVHTVHNPGGTERLHDVIGYASIGSGAIHALQALIAFGHSATDGYRETVYQVYAAKRRAEAAPGVGRDTDMAVITRSGAHWLAQDDLDSLKSVYDAVEAPAREAALRKLGELRFEEDETDDSADGEPTDAPGDPADSADG